MTITFAAYVLLIEIVGFLAATILFLLAMFRVVGFRSWPAIGGLSVGISFCYYLIFVRWLGMIFPEGLLFR